MAEYWSAWDGYGRYRIRLIVNETWTDAASNTSGGTWSLALFGASSWTFYGWTTTGSVVINGSTVASWNAQRPASAWTSTSGVTLASGTWGGVGHNSDGSKTISVSASYNATGTPDSYGPANTLSVSGSLGLTDFSRIPAKPNAPTYSEILPTSVKVSWIAPSSPLSITNYDLHVCTSQEHTEAACAAHYNWTGNASTSKTLTGLTPATTYYASIRAQNSDGTSVWSNWSSFTTLSGAYVSLNGVWVAVPMYVSDGSAWEIPELLVSDGTAWEGAL